jgi:ubiquinone/menaquinone biosynthesis C-methylase UbiE
MKLNAIEFIAMNNPVRRFIQDRYELPILRAMSPPRDIETALEIGCGSGHGTKLIRKYFSAANIIAVDLDERMIQIAARRSRDASVSFTVTDASRLAFPDARFDAVFDFGIIHHVPDWRTCVREIARVLRPGGEFICEDLSLDSFTRDIGKLWRILSDHPYDRMYGERQFTGFLGEAGLEITGFRSSNPMKLIRHFSLRATKR